MEEVTRTDLTVWHINSDIEGVCPTATLDKPFLFAGASTKCATQASRQQGDGYKWRASRRKPSTSAEIQPRRKMDPELCLRSWAPEDPWNCSRAAGVLQWARAGSALCTAGGGAINHG